MTYLTSVLLIRTSTTCLNLLSLGPLSCASGHRLLSDERKATTISDIVFCSCGLIRNRVSSILLRSSDVSNGDGDRLIRTLYLLVPLQPTSVALPACICHMRLRAQEVLTTDRR